MRGLQLASLYSLGCPELKKMGKEELILEFVRNPQPDKLELIGKSLERLEPFLFYQLIGLQNGIADPFNEDIVRAYWLGNSLLKPIAKKDVRNLLSLRELGHHQLQLMKILDLIKGKAHHNFETLWLIKGQKFFPKFLENLNNCLVRAGEVIEIKESILRVKTQSVIFRDKEIVLEDWQEKIKCGFVGKIEKGDYISIHLGMVREKIQMETAEDLLKITKEAISFFKRAK